MSDDITFCADADQCLERDKCRRSEKPQYMEYLDTDKTPLHFGYHPDMHTAHGLICKADKEIDAGGITGFMAHAAATMVIQCHERGEEFQKAWDKQP